MASNDDKFARESFTFRRMTRWQVWAMAIVAIAVLIILLGYGLA